MTSRDKHSVEVHGKGTSVNVAPQVWKDLRLWAKARGITVSQLITEIEDNRKYESLSNEIRIKVLEYFKKLPP